MSTLDEEVKRIKERDDVDVEELARITGLSVDIVSAMDLSAVVDIRNRELASHAGKALARQVIQQGNAPPDNPFELWTVDDLREQSSPAMHIEGVLPKGVDVMVYGPSYTGKSLGVLDMLLSKANGIPWMGHNTGAPSYVAYICGEGQRGISKRVDAWLDAHPGCTDDRLAVIPIMPNIRSTVEVDYLLQAFLNAAPFGGVNPSDVWYWPISVVAFDTWQRLTVGANENDNTAMTECVTALSHFRQLLGQEVTSIVVHHTGKSDTDTPRGASTFTGAFDVLIHVSDGQIENPKMKDGEEFPTIPFEIVKSGPSVTVRRLGIVEGVFKKASDIRLKVRELLHEANDRTISDLCKFVKGHRRAEIRDEVDLWLAEPDSDLTEREGKGAGTKPARIMHLAYD